jgi:hypothetical protein
VLAPLFHAWERRLASAATNRIVRPFEWGLDWIDSHQNGHVGPEERLDAYVRAVLGNTEEFYTPPPTDTYHLERHKHGPAVLTFASSRQTPHAENNTVYARYFPGRPGRGGQRPRRAVVVLPQWNADSNGHIGLARLISRTGVSALRLSLPYHDERMPPELSRADYIVSSNVARTLEVCRQAVHDTRRAVWWLRECGYERIGILGTSLGSCLAMLTGAHEPLIRALALNHISPYFADVVWRGLSTEHVREGLEGHVDVDQLRELWRPISPWSFIDRLHDKNTLMVYAKYDLTFPIDLSLQLIKEIKRRGYSLDVRMLPCGHYSTGSSPFKYLDAWYLGKFLATKL